MRKFIMILNNCYIGSMKESFAHSVASTLCAKVGDILTLQADDEDYYTDSEVYPTHTYYHNGTEVLCFSHTEDQFHTFTSEEEIQGKLRTKTYTNRLTGFKYDRSDAKRGLIRRRSMKDAKRVINRAARRVGKELTREQLAA